MTIDTASEEHRFRCEVRQILRWRAERGSAFAHRYINGERHVVTKADARGRPVTREEWAYKGVRQMRGDEAADILMAHCMHQWAAGNDGTGGVWL